MNSNRLIGMGAVISFATIAAASLSGQKNVQTGQVESGNLPSSREWIGLSVVFLMLSAATDLGIESAGGMAVLVMVTVLLARGEDAAAYLGIRLGTTPNTPLNRKIQKGQTPKRIQNTAKTLGINSNSRKSVRPGNAPQHTPQQTQA